MVAQLPAQTAAEVAFTVTPHGGLTVTVATADAEQVPVVPVTV